MVFNYNQSYYFNNNPFHHPAENANDNPNEMDVSMEPLDESFASFEDETPPIPVYQAPSFLPDELQIFQMLSLLPNQSKEEILLHLQLNSLQQLSEFFVQVLPLLNEHPLTLQIINLLRDVYSEFLCKILLEPDYLFDNKLHYIKDIYNLIFPLFELYPKYLVLYRFRHSNYLPVNGLDRLALSDFMEKLIKNTFDRFLNCFTQHSSHQSILSFLLTGQLNKDESLLADFWKDSEQAFQALDFLKNSNMHSLISELLLPEKIHSHHQLINFHSFLTSENKIALIEKIYKNIRVKSSQDIVLTAPPTQELAELIHTLDCFLRICYERPINKKKRKQMDDSDEEKPESPSPHVKKFDRTIKPKTSTQENITEDIPNLDSPWKHFFTQLPRSLQRLDLADLEIITQEDWILLQNSPVNLLCLSSDIHILDDTSTIELNDCELNIEWLFKNNIIPPFEKVKSNAAIRHTLNLTTHEDISDECDFLHKDFPQISTIIFNLDSSEKLISLLLRFLNLTFILIQNPYRETNPQLFPILKSLLETYEKIGIDFSANDINLHLEQMDVNAPEFEDFLFVANHTIDYAEERFSIQINEAKIQKILLHPHLALTVLRSCIEMEEETYHELLRSCEEYLIDIQPNFSDSDENVYNIFERLELSRQFHTDDRVQAAPVLASECWFLDVSAAILTLPQTRHINSLDVLLQLFIRIVPYIEVKDLPTYYAHALQLFEFYEKLILNIRKYENLITQCLTRKDFLHFEEEELIALIQFIHAPRRVDAIYNEYSELIFLVIITALQKKITILPENIRLASLKHQLLQFFLDYPDLGIGNEALVSSLMQDFDSRYDPVAYVKLAYAAKKPLKKDDHYSSIFKGFQSLLQSVNPDQEILVYWALEILKTPPAHSSQSSSIIHRCMALCFSQLSHNPTFFHEHQEVYKKLSSKSLKVYLLQYLAEEKEGHLQLLEEDLKVSHLLSKSFDESVLSVWNIVLEKLHRLTKPPHHLSPIFNILLDHLTHPFQLQLAQFFIDHQIHTQDFLTEKIFLFLINQETMTPGQIRFCQDHIPIADPALVAPFVNRIEFQASILDIFIQLTQIVPSKFLPIWSQIKPDQLLDENRADLLSICNRIGKDASFISTNNPLASHLYSILQEDPSLYKHYPHMAQFLILFFLPSETDNHETFFRLLEAIDPILIPSILNLLVIDINKIDQQNSVQIFHPYAYYLVLNHLSALVTQPALAAACHRTLSKNLTNIERSSQFNTNYVELLIVLIKTRIPISSVTHPPLAFDLLKKLETLESQSCPLTPERRFLATTTLSAITLSLDESLQKYCLRIIKENGRTITCETIHPDNSLILDEILDLIQSHEDYPYYAWLQAILQTGHFERMKEKILPFLKKIDQTKNLPIEDLYSLINIDILSEKQKSEMLAVLSKERQNQLLNFRYNISIESLTQLRSQLKPQQVSIIIPEEAKTLNLNRFIDLFDQLGLDKPDHGIDLIPYYTDKLTSPKKFREYLLIFLTNIRERNPELIAVPPEPNNREKFYLEIENCLKTALYHMLNQLENQTATVKDFHPHLFGMCQAGTHCGKAYQDIARTLYCIFSKIPRFETRSLQDQIIDVCHELAWKYARQVSSESPLYVNTHFHTAFTKFWENLIGSENGKLEIQQEEDGSNNYLQEVQSNRQHYHDQFLSLFTSESCLNTVWEQYTSHRGASIDYQKLFESHNIPDEVAWGEDYDDPRTGFRILLKTLGIIELKPDAPNFEELSEMEKS